jgi:multidrug efflux pump subunit AcrA (membrane-fusion protein)
MKGYIKYIAFLVVILLSILWLGGFFSKKISTKEVAKESKVVHGLTVGTVERLDYVETPYIGQVVADQRAEISSRIMGRVLKVHVKEGECVRAGRLLVSVDASDVQAQVNAIEQQRETGRKGIRICPRPVRSGKENLRKILRPLKSVRYYPAGI